MAAEGLPVSTSEFTRRLLILAVFLVVGAFLYATADLLLIVFGTIMFAVILSSAANVLHRKFHLKRGLGLAVVVVVSLVFIGAVLTLFGTRIGEQVSQLIDTLPAALGRLRAVLGQYSWGPKLIHQVQQLNYASAGGTVLGHAWGVFSSVLGIVTNLILIFFGSLYLAASPDLYVNGFLSLVPPRHRPRAAEVLEALYDGLRHWLVGQFISMLVVGAAFGIALSIIGVPSAIVLGIIAALLEFIPLLGPVIATIPAMLEALTQGTSTVIWVAVAFLVIQQLESNLLVPYVQKRAVELPPIIGLFATVVFGLIFGAVGLIFAVPLAVVVMIAVREIYVKTILEGEGA